MKTRPIRQAATYLCNEVLEVLDGLGRVGAHVDGRTDGLGVQVDHVHFHRDA